MYSLMKCCLAILLVLLVYPPYQVECAERSVHFKLLTDLTNEYDSPTLRPVNDTEDVVYVGFRFAPVLTFLDETAQELNTRGIYLLTWRDYRLAWDPTNYDEIREINLPLFKDGVGEKNIWKPELVLYESVGARRVSFQPETQAVTVKHTGHVYWYTLATTKSDCTVIVRHYPFDIQVCHMRFTTWLYQTNEQLFYAITDLIESEAYKNYEVKSEIWDVAVRDVEVGNASYECISCKGEEQSYVHYTLELSRNNVYMYVINLMLPCLVMSGMTLIVVWLPKNDVTAAASFGVTCILTFNVFLTYLFGQLPSTGLPLIGNYMVWLIVEAVIITVYGVQRAIKERKKEKRSSAKSKISNADSGETGSSDNKPSRISSAKNMNNVECRDVSSTEEVDAGDMTGTSLKLTKLRKSGNYNRVNAGKEEATLDECQGSSLQVSGQGEVSKGPKDDKDLRLRVSASSKEDPEGSDTTTKIHSEKNSFLRWTMPHGIQTWLKHLTLKQAMMCMKVVTSLVFITIFLIFVFL
ncbi:Neuronal acetylcholine receptor subunit alpha-6 [Holothuria leucospilota]|uniref:Neuronal acetylcholine receptor subunit alpha-6 n=1 Tax=Holothuria leucospilota TaxID=206669 RepID=A0A9Q1CNE0_HOLLE|nr:Neuronal acetylcholine receptor subunit alpha-6 [Holothuria leucospilota]